jgi:transcriptional regulator with XRE-family HTH domain
VPDDDEMPDLATSSEWREIMVRARKEPRPPDYPNGMTQQQLGEKVGVSQVTISKIESGEQGSSTHILAICRVLGVPAPQHFADEHARMWADLGHVLRHGDPEQYEQILRMVELQAKRAIDAQRKATVPEPTRPDKRK